MRISTYFFLVLLSSSLYVLGWNLIVYYNVNPLSLLSLFREETVSSIMRGGTGVSVSIGAVAEVSVRRSFMGLPVYVDDIIPTSYSPIGDLMPIHRLFVLSLGFITVGFLGYTYISSGSQDNIELT
jgi:hypothetical protein